MIKGISMVSIHCPDTHNSEMKNTSVTASRIPAAADYCELATCSMTGQ
jgi:hypothetical protein